jgi:hypothetical protein
MCIKILWYAFIRPRHRSCLHAHEPKISCSNVVRPKKKLFFQCCEASIYRDMSACLMVSHIFCLAPKGLLTPQPHHVNLPLPLPLALYPQQPHHPRLNLTPQHHLPNHLYNHPHQRHNPPNLHLQPYLRQPRKTPKEKARIQKLRSRRRRSSQLRLDAPSLRHVLRTI